MTNSSRKKPMLSSPRNEVQKKLEEQIHEGEQILRAPIKGERDFKLAKEANESWYDYTRDLLSSLFNTDDIRQEFVQTIRYHECPKGRGGPGNSPSPAESHHRA